ncbi:SH3 domain-containing protein [Rheinheimera soli]|uniref:SH3 domain-containing protein n=1 Tax=Rheinheimera soli TaxID=443616 RepID=UPI001E3C2BD2|nr:SH3 domain-containing protein [Rheinheimera soli]
MSRGRFSCSIVVSIGGLVLVGNAYASTGERIGKFLGELPLIDSVIAQIKENRVAVTTRANLSQSLTTRPGGELNEGITMQPTVWVRADLKPPRANLRKYPSTAKTSQIIGQVTSGSRLQVRAKHNEGTWLEITDDRGLQGFIHGSLVTVKNPHNNATK